MNRLPVFFEQRSVGSIDVGKGGAGFFYHPDWIGLKGAFPISTTMPVRTERYGAETFLPWAANLLPENEQLRTLGQLLGMAAGDVIGLLSAIGGDTAGALSIGQPGRLASVHWRPMNSAAELERLIEELPNKPFLAGDEGISMSLAGAQTKLAVAVDETGRICVPMNGSPSTHILKPDAARLPGGVQNEAFCLTLARRLKIVTPGISTGRAGARTFLLLERFDRVNVAGRWRRLHQEDFCQALGKPPSAKYEVNHTGVPGPGVADMFEVTRRHMPPTDVLRLLDMIVFSVLACNTDAHAKNYSVLIRANSASLAPLYDVMCGAVWTTVTKNLSQKIGGAARATDVRGSHWQRFAKECGLNPRLVMERVGALAKTAIAQSGPAAEDVASMPAGDHEILAQVRSAVDERANLILAQLSQVEFEPANVDVTPAEQAPSLDLEAAPDVDEEAAGEPAIEAAE